LRAIPTAPTLVLAGWLAVPAPALADGNPPVAPVPPAPEAAALVSAGEPPAASPGLDLTQPSSIEEKAGKPLVKQWWFWTALGVVVGASVVILTVTDRGSFAPKTTLGNREFQP
jgi:hypothetical protein